MQIVPQGATLVEAREAKLRLSLSQKAKLWVVLVVLLGSASESPSAPGADSAELFRGAALVGVDSLGRVLLAFDKAPTDGFVDMCFLYTADYRLQDPWSRRIRKAELLVKKDSLRLVSEDLVVSLAIKNTADGRRTASLNDGRDRHAFSEDDGMESIRSTPKSPSVRLAQMTIEDMNSGWPPDFAYDLLDPGTSGEQCVDADCQAGGIGSVSCSISCVNVTPPSCSASCSQPLFFACCRCDPWAKCSCRKCTTP